LATLPQPSRAPTKKEIAVLRGHADSLALTLACHDASMHARLAPRGGLARSVFEAVERVRVEAVGATRMKGVADNLTAKIEARFETRAPVPTQREDAPLDECLALIVRERMLGVKPPKRAAPMVEVWRSWIDDRASGLIDSLSDNLDDQEAFGRQLRNVLSALELMEEEAQGSEDEASGDDDEGDQQAQGNSEASGQDQETKPVDADDDGDGDAGGAEEDARLADASDRAKLEDEAAMDDRSRAPPRRPNISVLEDPASFGYQV
jgi:cobaltochelatase CobT